ncbi:hypothetical protein FVEN_g8685 [Fusarium venenatum]|uniref:Chromo domain-containing protein n=1 Tax=Fusarium venenatum TaxID=56646 RepID=A0A2L2T697_9HYPO|nr:uncharacterized protein FVRRES_12159 [Fusarium venenatum]KAG8353401.1 hypothetical protein FVEN_g8685 [Fusarium venenatum]KAH6978795.1 hypothetical protein EDB82DRAFT_477526 [Fusarium venenatum]CEI39468.1 unnamed protein product [Fusarium venenatum]
MVKTRKATASNQTRKQRTSLNQKSKRKRDQDSESDVEPQSARKRRKSGIPQRSSRSHAQVEYPDQDSEDTEKESSEDSDKQENTVLKRGWYLVRAVIDERFESSDGETKHEYLVDWVPGSQETYQPTWELAENLNADALKDWEKKKDKRERQKLRREAERQNTRTRRGLRSLTPRTASAEPAAFNARQQLETFNSSLQNRSRSNSINQGVRTRNRRRLEQESAFSEESVPSIVSASSVDIEAVRSLESPARPIRNFAIVLRKPDNFDPSEYQSVHSGSQRISDLEDDDQRLVFTSQLSQDTIPDSQDLSGRWDPRNLGSQAGVQGPDTPGIPADQLSVAESHLEQGDQGKSTRSPEIHNPVQAIADRKTEIPQSVDRSAELDSSSPEPSQREACFEDGQLYYGNGGDTGVDNHSDDENRETDGNQTEQDFEVDDSEIEDSIRNQLLEDNQNFHRNDTANSGATQEPSNCTDSYVPPDQQSQSQQPDIDSSFQPSHQGHFDTFSTKPSQRPGPPSEETTRLEAQLSSSNDVSRIIPDSQYSNLTAELNPNVPQSLNKAQITPFASQAELVPDSATTGSDIPSHQPNQSRLPSLVRGDAFDSFPPTDHRAPTSLIQEFSTPNNTQNTQVFFTQPQGIHDSPVISSSLSRLETSQGVQASLVSGSSSKSTGVPGDFNELQAAHSQSQNSEFQPQRDANSQELRSTSDYQFAQHKPGINYSTERRSEQPSETHSASQSPLGTRKMERSYSQPRSLAADELKSFVDFGTDSVLDQAGDGESLDATSYGVSNEQEPILSASTAGLDIAVSSSEAIIQSQPVYSVDPWKPEALGTTPEAPAPSISPASIMANPHRSAVPDSMREMIDRAYSNSRESIARSLMSQEPHDRTPSNTISPAAISRVVDPLETTHTLNLINRGTIPSEIDSPGPSITMGQIPDEQESDISSQSSQPEVGHTQHVITLPMQASKRPYYGQIIKDYKVEIEAFSAPFTGEPGEQPSRFLVQKIRDLFDRLFDICDYPPNVVGTALESEPSADIAKFCCDSNPKFSFLFELMTALDEKEKEILIVIRNQELMRLVFALTEVAEIECSAEGINRRTNFPSATRITLALWNEDFNPFNFDVVIGFDYRYIRSGIAMQLASGTGRKSPVVLLMVTTYSAEHVSLHSLDDASELEQTNAMLAWTVHAGCYLEDPERGYGEPHEIAEIFAGYLNGINGTLNWEPQGIPRDVFNIFEAPMSQNQLLFAVNQLHGNGHKRKFSDGEAADAKRTRTLPLRDPPVGSNNPPMPLATRRWLDGALLRGEASNREATISVRVVVLDSLREQADEYERKVSLANEVEIELKTQINRLDKEIKDYQKATTKIEWSNRAAIQDRTVFEKEKSKAEAALQAAKAAKQKEDEKYKQKIVELESTISRLRETPGAAEREDALAAAQKKIRTTEEKLKVALADVDFMRSRYQDVDSTATRLSNEVNALKVLNKDLEQKASENLLAIHVQQASGERQAMQQQIANLQAQLQQRDAELIAAHQKLNSFVNGRNTRGGSMPRSPRVPSGVSPRPSRVYPGSASRGTSPSGPGTQFMSQQAQNTRWNSLQ